MIQAYKKLLNMKSVDKNKAGKILYQDKDYIVNKLIAYLKKELNIEYFQHEIIDLNGNKAIVLIKENSKIFKENIEQKELVNFHVEELIDKRMFENKNEVIILDINSEENLLDLEYMCESLEYNYLSYSEEIKNELSNFVNYVLNKVLINGKI